MRKKKKRKAVYIRDAERRLVGLKCPRCGADADGAARFGWERLTSGEAVPGALVMCAYCGGLSMYTETLGLRRVERPERRKIVRENPELGKLLEMAAESVARVQARRRAGRAQWN
jgi:hypothetical protein